MQHTQQCMLACKQLVSSHIAANSISYASPVFCCLSVCWFVCVSVSVCLLVTAVSATKWLSRPRCHFECGLWGPNEPCIRWWSRSRPKEGALLGIRRGHAYGCEMWATTRYLCARIDAFDTRDLHRILSMSYSRHIANAEMMAVSAFQQ